MSNLLDPRIEDEATEGLGVAIYDSLAYRIAEIENHIHSPRYWYGRNLTTGFLERSQLARFTVVAGTLEDWGTELQISEGTEIESGDPNKYFDSDGFFVSSASMVDKNYEIEFWYGTGIFSTATFLTSTPYRTSHNNTETQHIILHSKRIHCNNKLWVRCKCEQDGGSINFRLGFHIYEG